MIVCPVCEHQQAQGAECQVCGKTLVATRAPDLPAVTLPELEGTRLAGAEAPVAAVALPELERTELAKGPDLPLVAVPDLDLARAPAVTVPVERLAEMDLHREEQNPAERTAAPAGAITCRYCRNVQAEGMVCDKCGMRLPRYVPTGGEARTASYDPDEAPIVKHPCGVRTRAGRPCSSCGVFVPMPT